MARTVQWWRTMWLVSGKERKQQRYPFDGDWTTLMPLWENQHRCVRALHVHTQGKVIQSEFRSLADKLNGGIKAKTARAVATPLMNEIFPRFRAPLKLVICNGTENVNDVMTDAVKSLNMHRISTSPYHLQGKESEGGTFPQILGRHVSRTIWGKELNCYLVLNQTIRPDSPSMTAVRNKGS